MNRKKATRDIMELFIRLVSKYNALERIPVKLGSKHNLYHSERHMVDTIGDHPGMNVTEFARAVGVTKGAISQVVKRLETKGVVQRYKSSNNDKEVFIELTKEGQELYETHQRINEETMKPLYEELRKYPDDKVEYLVTMFRWFDEFLDRSREKMKRH